MIRLNTFGTFLAPYHRIGESPFLGLRRDLELVKWCDDLGLDEAWFGEHHSAGWETIGDPAIMIAAAGEMTRYIRLGSGVVSLPYHHPLMVADRFVQLDLLTRGRAMLGVGPGALISDAAMMGIDPVTQRPRMIESLGVIMRLLAGETVTHISDWFEVREAKLQMLPINGSIPVAVAATTSPAGMVAAGMHGVGVLSLGGGLVGGKKDLAAHWEIAEETAAKHGKTMDRANWRLAMRVHLADTREEAIRDVEEGREHERHGYFRRVAGLRSETTLEQEIAEGTVIVGTPEDAIATLEKAREETGGFGGLLVLGHEWTNREKVLHSYELLARYVVPHFRGWIDPVKDSYETVISHKRDYGSIAMAAIKGAYTDAGKELPPELNPANLR